MGHMEPFAHTRKRSHMHIQARVPKGSIKRASYPTIELFLYSYMCSITMHTKNKINAHKLPLIGSGKKEKKKEEITRKPI